MFELQKVEQEIHKKMVENVHRSILPQGAQERVRIMKNLTFFNPWIYLTLICKA